MDFHIRKFVFITVSIIYLGVVNTDAEVIWNRHTVIDNYNGAGCDHAEDIDSDGDMDALGVSSPAGKVAWFENDGNFNFTERVIATNFSDPRSPLAVDMDGDDDFDVIAAAAGSNEITWWENDGDENFAEHVIDGNFTGARRAFPVDLDGDGDIDVVGAALPIDEISWWENDGDENFTKHQITTTFDAALGVWAEDMDGDGDIDVLGTATYDDGEVAWFENDGDEDFTEHTIKDNWDWPQVVHAADINSDGSMDVLASAWYANEIIWWENDGDENFIEHLVDGNFGGGAAVLAIDVDGDYNIDVVGSGRTADEIAWWQNDGNENFTKYVIEDNLDWASSVYATDMDGDTDVDIIGAGYDADEIVWWEQVPPVEITLTPLGTPIVIPPQGGAFASEAIVTNHTNDPQTTEAWCSIEVPGGFQFVVNGPNEYTFDPGSTDPHMLFQFVPENAPAGDYVFHGFLGEHPWNVMDFDCFSFTKEGEGGEWAGQDGWQLTGNFFENHTGTGETIPESFTVSAHPNPFNPSTTIRYTLPEASVVHLAVYDIQGRLVETLTDGWGDAGFHEVTFDASRLASGLYFYRIEAGNFTAVKKMILMK
jgi:hypothetical protein